MNVLGPRRKVMLVALAISASASAAPVSVMCTGDLYNMVTGRQLETGFIFSFDFDPQAQTMVVTQGLNEKLMPLTLTKVIINDALVEGRHEEQLFPNQSYEWRGDVAAGRAGGTEAWH